MQTSRLAKRAIKQGWLVNREQRKSYPANYELGEPMPEVEGLLLLGVDTVNNEAVNTFSFKNEGVNTLTALTDGNIHPSPGIPCVKGDGTCGLRTYPDTPFDCAYSPKNCPFLLKRGGGA